MIQRPKVKWIAPIVLSGALIAGSSVAIAAATWNDSDTDASVDLPFRPRPPRADVEARKAEMQERLAARVESGEITQAEADDIQAKMVDRKAKLRKDGPRPSEADMEARKAEMQERLAARVESGEITQAEADDIQAKMADRKAKFQKRKGTKRG